MLATNNQEFPEPIDMQGIANRQNINAHRPKPLNIGKMSKKSKKKLVKNKDSSNQLVMTSQPIGV